MSTSHIIARLEGQAGRISLNRPEALHALNTDMCLAMMEALQAWADDPAVALVLVDHAEGTRGFCAGGDIRMLAESGAADGRAAYDFFAAEYRMNALIASYPKPYVAVMDGVAMGGGVGISVHGSHRIATENTLFAMPETGIGLFPDVGGGWFLPRLGGALGMWLALTGARLKGEDVAAAGIATQYVESAALDSVKQSLVSGDLALLEAMEWDAYGSFTPNMDVLQRCFSKDSVEAILAALDDETSEWAAKQAATLRTKSPQTLKVSFRQLKEGAAFEAFEENMKNEYRIARRVVHRHDFQEGVRAVVIDKDNAPKWSPPTLEEVDEDVIDAIFAPLGEDELSFTP
ncbi:MAG: enoyl-CoA hydratase/isomerase family protein [Pseudomonadota bacterium]